MFVAAEANAKVQPAIPDLDLGAPKSKLNSSIDFRDQRQRRASSSAVATPRNSSL
jgi:hypothetical protein